MTLRPAGAGSWSGFSGPLRGRDLAPRTATDAGAGIRGGSVHS